jgi:quercetin dioxygenase-like cupin family protein
MKKVLKGWGDELWIVNNEKYCGKLMTFEMNKRCSWHYHKLKDETFYILAGSFRIKYSKGDDFESAPEMILCQGDVFEVPIGLRHQMVALEPDSKIMEFSTQHFDSDSYRIIKGD